MVVAGFARAVDLTSRRYLPLVEVQPESVVDADHAAFVRSGVAIVVATRDDDMRPEVTRAWGADVATDGASVTVCVAAPPGSQTRSNLERNGAIAVNFTLPTTYRSAQMKGSVLDVRDPSQAELARVERHIALFADQTEQVGLTRSGAQLLAERNLLAVTFAVRELYDQTPGPNAGKRI
jgi:flavin reductase (DIM6/NTAB) family NADH-FMN oxidoreductase RutF